MNKIRFFKLIILALMVLNIMLLFLHFNRPGGPGKLQNEPKNIIIKKLNFDAVQIEKYKKLIEIHRHLILKNEKEINDVKNKLYLQLNQQTDTTITNHLYNEIAMLQKNALMLNISHFKDIKSICKPEQLPYFEKLVGELSQIFAPKMNRPKNKFPWQKN